MKAQNFQMVQTNGVTLRTVVEGDGPLVILLHGWPQCWYLWRHQIDPLVKAGYKVAVPDQRGYGGSDCPPNISDYDIRTLAADVAGVATALGYSEFKLIGHDWGCVVAWNTALLHEDVCQAVMGLSVPFWRMTDAAINPPGMDDRFWYMRYFQEEGRAEAELEKDLERSLRVLYYGLCGDAPSGTWMKQLDHPKSSGLLDALPEPTSLPSWLTSEDLSYYVEQYQNSGFAGPINWYRNIPTNNKLTPELEGKKFRQPAAFAAGAKDDVLLYNPRWKDTFSNSFEDLRFVEIIDGAGHWVQAEKPAATTALILEFLAGL